MQQPVFILLDSSGSGGIESHVQVLAQALAPHCDVRVLLWRQYHDSHPLLTQLAADGIYYEILDGRLRNLIGLWRAYPNAVLHCHGYKANLLGRLAGLLLNRRCICTFHNGDTGVGRVRLYTWLDEWTSRLSQNIAVSREIATRLSARCVLMPNMVVLDQTPVLSGNHTGAVAFVGRLEQVKRPDRFCELARQFRGQPFAIWGAGSLSSALALDKPDNLSLMGAVPNMSPYWSQIDVLVICSDQEGFPMVALEAMGAGVPVITLPLGDLPSLINHGENGFIAKDPAELGFYLALWLHLPAIQRLKIRQQARQTILQGYCSTQLWPKLLPLYRCSRGAL